MFKLDSRWSGRTCALPAHDGRVERLRKSPRLQYRFQLRRAPEWLSGVLPTFAHRRLPCSWRVRPELRLLAVSSSSSLPSSALVITEPSATTDPRFSTGSETPMSVSGRSLPPSPEPVASFRTMLPTPLPGLSPVPRFSGTRQITSRLSTTCPQSKGLGYFRAVDGSRSPLAIMRQLTMSDSA
jgi:hypothetical protein